MASISEVAPIQQHIEDIIRGFIDAIQNHDFSLHSPAWSHTSRQFRVTPLLPLPGEQPGNLTLEEWLTAMQQSHPPHQRIWIDGLTLYVDVRRGRTEVYGNLRYGSVNEGEGVKLPVVSYYLFQRDDEDGGRWKCDRIRSARGMEFDPFG